MLDLRQQPMVKQGDLISFNTGRKLSQAEVNGYNHYTRDFNRTMQTDQKEFLLDQRHRYLVQCFNA